MEQLLDAVTLRLAEDEAERNSPQAQQLTHDPDTSSHVQPLGRLRRGRFSELKAAAATALLQSAAGGPSQPQVASTGNAVCCMRESQRRSADALHYVLC